MSASDVIRRCREVGVRIRPNGDRLHVEAPAGAVTPELREALARSKPEILALHAIRARLHTISAGLGIPREVVDQMPLEELESAAAQAKACHGCKDGNGQDLAGSLLVFYLRQLAETTTHPSHSTGPHRAYARARFTSRRNSNG